MIYAKIFHGMDLIEENGKDINIKNKYILCKLGDFEKILW